MNDLRQRCEAFLKELRAFAHELVGTWTTEKPTKPGWYWWRTTDVNGKTTVRGVVEIEADGYCRPEGDYVDNLGGQWAGPIAEPEDIK